MQNPLILQAFIMEHSTANFHEQREERLTNPFVLKEDQYQRDIDFFDNYVKDSATYLAKVRNLDYATALEFVKSTLQSQDNPITDTDFYHTAKLPNGDRKLAKSGIVSYVRDAVKNDHYLSPSLTIYNSKKRSLQSQYVENNVGKRNRYKKQMHQAKAKEDMLFAMRYNNLQSGTKLLNNGQSGAASVQYSSFFSISSHPTLTSTCRLSAGFGSVNNEKLLGGNRHYYDHHTVIENIVSVCTHLDIQAVNSVINIYGLHIPTVEDTMDVIIHSTKLYGVRNDRLKEIRLLVNTLTDCERVAFCYQSDMYHLAKFNPELVKRMLTEFITTIEHGDLSDQEVEDTIKSLDPETFVTVRVLLKDHLSGVGVGSETKEQRKLIALTAINFNNTLLKYSCLIKGLMTHVNLPPKASAFPSALRRQVITSNTDSTIFTVANWVEWYTGNIEFNSVSYRIAEIMCYFARMTITHILALFSANLGLKDKKLFRIQLKNEFFFPVYVNLNVKSHYFNLTEMCEGFIYKQPEIDIKGLQLKSSKAPVEVIKFSDSLINEVLNDVRLNKGLDLKKIIQRVVDFENGIKRNVQEGKIDNYRILELKNFTEYKLDADRSFYYRYTFWQETFKCKYGDALKPPLAMIKIPVDLSNPTKLKAWINSMDDELKGRMLSHCNQHNKTNFNVMYVPFNVYESKGIPKEIIDIVNVRSLISDICISIYGVLSGLGIQQTGKKGKNVIRLLSDTYVSEDELKLLQ